MLKIVVCKSQEEIFDHLKVRHTVFVVEQQVSMEEEFDFLDRDAILINGMIDQTVVATARLLKKEHYIKVGRVAVLKEYRGLHYGFKIMQEIEHITKDLGYHEIHLSSQVHAKPFYESLGYQSYGDLYYDANILHIDMAKKLVG